MLYKANNASSIRQNAIRAKRFNSAAIIIKLLSLFSYTTQAFFLNPLILRKFVDCIFLYVFAHFGNLYTKKLFIFFGMR